MLHKLDLVLTRFAIQYLTWFSLIVRTRWTRQLPQNRRAVFLVRFLLRTIVYFVAIHILGVALIYGLLFSIEWLANLSVT